MFEMFFDDFDSFCDAKIEFEDSLAIKNSSNEEVVFVLTDSKHNTVDIYKFDRTENYRPVTVDGVENKLPGNSFVWNHTKIKNGKHEYTREAWFN